MSYKLNFTICTESGRREKDLDQLDCDSKQTSIKVADVKDLDQLDCDSKQTSIKVADVKKTWISLIVTVNKRL